MKDTKYTKAKYRELICHKGMSIDEIAALRGVNVAYVRKEIRTLYERAAWANKLIGMADSNAAAKRELVSAPKAKTSEDGVKKGEPLVKRVPYEVQKAIDSGIAILDTSYLVDFFDTCEGLKKIIVPRFCIGEMKRIAEHEERIEEKAALEVKIKYLEEEAEILYVPDLPFLKTVPSNQGFKPRSFNFARYARFVWEREGKEIPCLSRSREVKVLLTECQSDFRKKNT